MTNGAQIGSAVMFVQELNRSVGFYQDVLALQVADHSPTAALLVSPVGAQLILRAMGDGAGHPLGAVGLQYVIWTAASQDDLDRCERALRARSALRDTRHSGEVTLVEGRDPDDVVLMVSYPGPDVMPMHKLPVRIYGW